MKTIQQSLALFLLVFFMSSCGGGSVSNNEFLGQLPGLAKKYNTDIEKLELKLKECTDMDKAFEYDKKAKLLKEEAEKALDEYVESNDFANIPFENLETNKFELLTINVKGTNRTRVNFVAKAKVTEDLKSKYGNMEKTFFAYIKAVDKDGNMIGKPTVMASDMGNRGPFTAGTEANMFGSLGPLYELGNFSKIILISPEEYKANK